MFKVSPFPECFVVYSFQSGYTQRPHFLGRWAMGAKSFKSFTSSSSGMSFVVLLCNLSFEEIGLILGFPWSGLCWPHCHHFNFNSLLLFPRCLIRLVVSSGSLPTSVQFFWQDFVAHDTCLLSLGSPYPLPVFVFVILASIGWCSLPRSTDSLGETRWCCATLPFLPLLLAIILFWRKTSL